MGYTENKKDFQTAEKKMHNSYLSKKLGIIKITKIYFKYKKIYSNIKLKPIPRIKILLIGELYSLMDSEASNNIENTLIEQGIEVIRFVSPHPKDFTDDVIDVISESKKISRLIHVPLQSGSTNVLKEMNRKYTKEQYLDLIKRIRNKIPDVVFSTDIIVGFPGETEEDFEDTIDVVKQVNFEQIFMFIYSRRVGTRADKMENQIPEEIKHKRFDRLKALVESQIEENNQKYLGTIQKVLIDGTSKTNENTLSGRTESNTA